MKIAVVDLQLGDKVEPMGTVTNVEPLPRGLMVTYATPYGMRPYFYHMSYLDYPLYVTREG